MKKIDPQVLHTLKVRLDDLPPREDLRPYDIIAELAESIDAARSRGYDIGDLVTVLSDVGINLTRNTVRNYLSKARTSRRISGSRNANPRSASVDAASSRTTSREEPPSDVALTTETSANRSAQAERTDRLAIARERVRAAREARERETRPRSPGSFDLIADKKDL